MTYIPPIEVRGACMTEDECLAVHRRQTAMAQAELARLSEPERLALAAVMNSNPDYSNERSNGTEIGLYLDEDELNTSTTMMRDGICYTRTMRPAERRKLIEMRRYYGIEDIVRGENGRRRNKDGQERRPRRNRAINRPR